MVATYTSVSFVNEPFVCVLGCVGFEVNKTDVNVWITVLVDFFVIGICEAVVVLDVVVLVVVVLVVCSVVVVAGFVVVVSGMYT